jgi:hypothetical protein
MPGGGGNTSKSRRKKAKMTKKLTIPVAATPRKKPGSTPLVDKADFPVSTVPAPLPTGLSAADQKAFEAILAPLRPQQADFIRAFILNGRNASAAVRSTGYSGLMARAKASGYQLMKRPEIRTALAALDSLLSRRTIYDFDKASANMVADREFAYASGNATAAVRASELLAKLHGHLNDRLDMRVQGDVAFILPPRGAPSAHIVDHGDE